MQDIIAISERELDGETVPTVDARELHAFLKVGKAFGAWIADRIGQYDFVQGTDYVVFSEIGNNSKGGRPTKHYAISIDMAKQLSMVERNDQGKQARLYFIECERQAKIARQVIPDFDKLVEQTEQTNKLVSTSNQQVAEIGRVIGGVTRNVVTEVNAKHGVMLRALGKLVNEYLVKRVILPLEKVDSRISRLERQVAPAIDHLVKRANHPEAVIWTEWLDIPAIYAKAGMNPPRRGILSQQVHRSLDAWCKRTGNQHAMKQMHGKDVWHVAAVNGWLDQMGRLLIQAHCQRHSTDRRAA